MRCSPLHQVLAASLLLGAVSSLSGSVGADTLPPLPKPPQIAAQLQPTVDGAGPGICEPVAKNASTGLADFGAGCARWLQFALGANVELGQMPPWSAQARGRKELGTTHLRLTAMQAARFAKSVGYTHLAIGEISGTPERCVLTYQLLIMPEQRPLGAPLKATGSEAQIVAALPGMARQLLTLLKVAKPQLPGGAVPSPAVLQSIGSYAWYPETTVLDADAKQMEALAAQQPLAGLLVLLHASLYNPKPLEAKCRLLLTQVPGNLMALSAFNWVGYGLSRNAYESTGGGAGREWAAASASREGIGSALSPAFRQDVDRSLQERPNNAIVAQWKFTEAVTLQEQITRSEQVARCSPRNPASWLQTAGLYSDAAENVRRGKLAIMMTAMEVDLAQQFNDRAVALAKRATDLDPNYSHAWLTAALVATFAGRFAFADTALWKAIQVDPTNPHPYHWGLQMYQQKWMDMPAKLAKVARLAGAQTFPADDTYAIYTDLHDVGYTAEAREALDRAMQSYRAAVKKQPDDAKTHRILGYRLFQQRQYRDAVTEEETALRLDPTEADAHYNLDLIYAANGHIDEAIAEGREALKIAPNFTTLHVTLGMVFEATNKWDAGDVEYRKALEADPENFQALRGLGYIRQQQNRLQDSIVYFEKAKAVEPTVPYPYVMLAFLYNSTNQFDKTIETGQIAVELAPNDPLGEEYLGNAYYNKGMYNECVPHFQKSMALNPRLMFGRGQLANAYLKLGKKAEAKTLLEEILRLSPNTVYSEDAQRVMKENF